jgi:hypothetical protein
MAEYQVEIEFNLGERERDVDLLERLGAALDDLTPETGPVAAIRGDRYSTTMTVAAETLSAAGARAASLVVDALNVALATTGDELDQQAFETLLERVHVDSTRLVHA